MPKTKSTVQRKPRAQKSGLKLSEAFGGLRGIPEFPDILVRLDRGDSGNAIAGWLKGLGHFPELQQRSLARQVTRLHNFTKGKPEFAKDRALAISEDTALVPVAAAEERKLREIEALEEMSDLQESRIKLIHQNELKINHLFPQTRQEIAEFRAINHTLIDKKRELRVPGYGGQPQTPHSVTNVQVNIEGAIDEGQMRVLQDPKSRRKVLSALKLLGRGEVAAEDSAQSRIRVSDRRVADESDGIIDVAVVENAENDDAKVG